MDVFRQVSLNDREFRFVRFFLRSQLVSGMQVVGVEVWSHKSGLPNTYINILRIVQVFRPWTSLLQFATTLRKNAQSLVGHHFQCGIATSTGQHQTTNIIQESSNHPMYPFHLPKHGDKKYGHDTSKNPTTFCFPDSQSNGCARN